MDRQEQDSSVLWPAWPAGSTGRTTTFRFRTVWFTSPCPIGHLTCFILFCKTFWFVLQYLHNLVLQDVLVCSIEESCPTGHFVYFILSYRMSPSLSLLGPMRMELVSSMFQPSSQSEFLCLELVTTSSTSSASGKTSRATFFG